MEEDFFIDRPATGERLPLGKRTLPDPRANILPDKPKVGLVISTYGALGFVELGLAVRQRLCPEVPTLVHDDASPVGAQLQELCGRVLVRRHRGAEREELEVGRQRLGRRADR